MIKIKKYEQPETICINLRLEGVVCNSFTGSYGGPDEDDGQLPGYNEEQFPW